MAETFEPERMICGWRVFEIRKCVGYPADDVWGLGDGHTIWTPVRKHWNGQPNLKVLDTPVLFPFWRAIPFVLRERIGAWMSGRAPDAL